MTQWIELMATACLLVTFFGKVSTPTYRRSLMDESGDQQVAYHLPVDNILQYRDGPQPRVRNSELWYGEQWDKQDEEHPGNAMDKEHFLKQMATRVDGWTSEEDQDASGSGGDQQSTDRTPASQFQVGAMNPFMNTEMGSIQSTWRGHNDRSGKDSFDLERLSSGHLNYGPSNLRPRTSDIRSWLRKVFYGNTRTAREARSKQSDKDTNKQKKRKKINVRTQCECLRNQLRHCSVGKGGPDSGDIYSTSRLTTTAKPREESKSRGVGPSGRSLKTVLIIGDELLEFLEGVVIRDRCIVTTESYTGLTTSDAEERVSEIFKEGLKSDKVIIHVGSNDIVTQLPSATTLVVQRLKQLIDTLKTAPNLFPSTFAISSILPRPEELTAFNNMANLINTDVRWYAHYKGVEYIDHFSTFWQEGELRTDLFFFDGSLNEDGMRLVEDLLLGRGLCDYAPETDPGKASSSSNRYRKKPSLELKDILPLDKKMYDKHLPPKRKGKPTIVYYHVTVLSLDSIDEESMTYVADVFLAQSWQDYRLRLPENMTEGYRILDVNWLKYIWRPDSFFKNAKKVTFHEMSVPNHYLWLYYDKTLLYMAKLTLEVSCAMKFEAYPHDTQNCSIMIESLSHTTDDLVFLWNITSPLVVSTNIELPQLDIVDSIIEDCTLEYSTGNFTCLAVVFHFRRRLGYHLFHTYVPTTLIVVMSWISFWIRPEAIPARVTLGVTSLLTLATQNTQSQSALPPVSYVKAIDVWMSSCTVFVFMSLMEFALVNHFMGYTGTNKMMRGYSAEDIEKIFRRANDATSGVRNNSLLPPPREPQMCCKDVDIALAIDKFSRFFFPFSFLVLNIIYWVTYALP